MGSVGGATWVSPARPEDPSFVVCDIEGLRKTLCRGKRTKRICRPIWATTFRTRAFVGKREERVKEFQN